MEIYLDLPIMAYLQVGEVPVGLTPKEWYRVVHKMKQFRWESNFLLQAWIDGQVQVGTHLKQCEGLVWHVHEELGHFGV
jgi:hypothetical protein